MKRVAVIFLQLIISLISIGVLAFCIFVLPEGIRSDQVGGYRPILLGMYITAIPFFIGIFQVLKLLHDINKNNVFTSVSITAFRRIKYCAIAISAFYTISMPYVFSVAQRDDAPGVVAIGCIVIIVSLIIATAAAVFQKLLQNVIDIKSENDLTV